MLYQDFKDIISEFQDANVDYLVVGGFAVIFYGYERFTKDFDLWVCPSGENAKRVVKALKQFGGFETLSEKDFTDPGTVVMLGVPPLRIDILTRLEGVDFEEAWKRKETDEIDEIQVHFISKADLIRNKQAVGRDQDLLDVKKLLSTPKRKAGKR